VLVNEQRYAPDGGVRAWIDPQGTVTVEERDAAGRRITLVENAPSRCAGGSAEDNTACCPPPVCPDPGFRTSEFQYAPDGGLSRLILRNPTTGDQYTTWIYGSTLANSAIASSLVPVQKIYPTGESETQTYNRQSEVATFTDANGNIHTYHRDKLGRLTDDSAPGRIGFPARISTSYDERGRVQYVTTADNATPGSGTVLNQVRLDYNGLDCLIADVQEHNGAVTDSSLRVQYTCTAGVDGVLRRNSVVYPSGRQISYDYGSLGSIADVLNRVDSVSDQDLTVLAEYTYVGAAMPSQTMLSDAGVQRTWKKLAGEPDGDGGDPYTGYDRFGRTQWMRWFKQSGEDYNPLVNVQWGYSRASLKTWRKDLQAPSSAQQDQQFGYDGLYQVSQRDRGLLNLNGTAIGGIPAQRETFSYDETGNWVHYQQQDAGSLNIDQPRTNNRSNQITTIDGLSVYGDLGTSSISYDKNGNMTATPGGEALNGYPTTMDWDQWNRLLNVSIGEPDSPGWAVTGYFYDGLSRRINVEVTDETNDDFWDPYYDDSWRVVEERFNEAATPDSQFVWHPANRWELLLRDRSTGHDGTLDERLYSMKDRLDPVAVCDATGAVRERYAYTAFGLPTFMNAEFTPVGGTTSAYDWNFLFHAEFADKATGWFDYGYRYYAPELGKWLSRDPIRTVGGFNLYRLVQNNPVNWTDLIGLVKVLNLSFGYDSTAVNKSSVEKNIRNQLAQLEENLKCCTANYGTPKVYVSGNIGTSPQTAAGNAPASGTYSMSDTQLTPESILRSNSLANIDPLNNTAGAIPILYTTLPGTITRTSAGGQTTTNKWSGLTHGASKGSLGGTIISTALNPSPDVLSHELGHYAGYQDSSNTLDPSHSSTRSNLMFDTDLRSSMPSKKTPDGGRTGVPDRQWCEKVSALAKDQAD
jgi:RHS repeat-associated protein